MEFENIEQLVKYVNINLKKGESITKLERALGLGKDTLRKKLNRANYKFNKELKAFVLDNNTEVTQDNITHHNTELFYYLSNLVAHNSIPPYLILRIWIYIIQG